MISGLAQAGFLGNCQTDLCTSNRTYVTDAHEPVGKLDGATGQKAFLSTVKESIKFQHGLQTHIH